MCKLKFLNKMKHEIRIGILDDDLLLTKKIITTLTALGYTKFVQLAETGTVLQVLKTDAPDIILLNTALIKNKTWADLVEKLTVQFLLPFILIREDVANDFSEPFTGKNKDIYLAKNFTSDQLHAAIDAAVTNHSVTSIPKLPGINKDFIFMKEHHRYIKILFKNIACIECRENYIIIHNCDKKNATIRSTFNDFLLLLPAGIFYRVHRSFAIQTELINSIENHEVIIGDIKVPLSSTYRDGLFALLGISAA